MEELFITSLKERNQFEQKFSNLCKLEISEFNGLLITWDSDKKLPIINSDFIQRLPNNKKEALQQLLDSLS